MKIPSRFACIALFAGMSISALAQSTPYVYVRSDVNQPWGQSTNEDAMDNIFSPGNWTTVYYETMVPSALFVSSTSFIFMEGGDSSFAAFQSFMNNYANTVYSWIQAGGRLVIMSAPNDPLSSATLYLPDNIVLHSDAYYGSAASSANRPGAGSTSSGGRRPRPRCSTGAEIGNWTRSKRLFPMRR